LMSCSAQSGGETLERSWAVLRSGGRFVTIAYSAADRSGDERIQKAAFMVKPSRTQLAEIADVMAQDRLHAWRTVPLSRSPEAYEGSLHSGIPAN
jgi:hypothetical protein